MEGQDAGGGGNGRQVDEPNDEQQQPEEEIGENQPENAPVVVDIIEFDDVYDIEQQSPSSSSSPSPSSSSSNGEESDAEPASKRREEEAGESDTNNMGAQASRLRKGRQQRQRSINFNQNLPATHSYLGQDFEDCPGGAAWTEPDTVLDNIPIFPVPGVVLMPGQTLPLQSLHPRRIAMFRRLIEHHSVFAVLTMRREPVMGGITRNEMANFGTLAQIVAFKEETEDVMSTLKLRAIGRQRFILLDLHPTVDGTPMGKLQILPEVYLPPPLYGVMPNSWLKLVRNKRFKNTGDKYLGSHLTAVSQVAFKECDMDEVVSRLVLELSLWYDPARIERLSANVVDFSFWVASNLPVNDDMKLQLLGINYSLHRLRWELRLMQQCETFCCRQCERSVCKKCDVFSMSVDGPMGAYVNPGGHVHEMLTVYHVTRNGVVGRGRPSTENSWFPGYAWTIQECADCGAHMGWKFGAVDKNLQPKKFWGLTRSAIWPVFSPNEEESEGRNESGNLAATSQRRETETSGRSNASFDMNQSAI